MSRLATRFAQLESQQRRALVSYVLGEPVTEFAWPIRVPRFAEMRKLAQDVYYCVYGLDVTTTHCIKRNPVSALMYRDEDMEIAL